MFPAGIDRAGDLLATGPFHTFGAIWNPELRHTSLPYVIPCCYSYPCMPLLLMCSLFPVWAMHMR